MSGEAAPPPELLEKLQALAQAEQALASREPVASPHQGAPPVVVVPEVAPPPPPPPPAPRKRAVIYSPDRPGFMRSWSEEFAAERAELRAELDESPLAPTTSTTGAGAAPATTRGDALRRLGVRGPRKP